VRPDEEFNGDQCVVLPKNFMASVDAAVELYDEDIAKNSKSFRVNGLEYGPGRWLLRVALAAGFLWLLPSVWALCV